MRSIEQPSIVLYGMAGSGVSTLGRGLTAELGFAYADTDVLIEELYGTSREELIQAGKFEDAQLDTILGYEPTDPTVIAAGDSVAMHPELVAHLGRFGLGVFIEPSPAELICRLPRERIDTLYNPDHLSFVALYNARLADYCRAAQAILKVGYKESPETSLARLKELTSRLLYMNAAYDW